MSSNKQTAVEWLESKMPTAFKELTINKGLFAQAKEMEKQQIIDANEDASTNELGEFLTGEQYYKQEYGGNK